MKIIIAYIVVIIVWSTTPLGVKLSVSAGDAFAPLVVRTAIGLLISLLCLSFMSERVRFSLKAWKVYASSALSIVGTMGLTYLGASYINSGMISVIYSLSPIVTGVFVVLFLKTETLGRMQLFGVMVAISGLAVVFQSELSVGGDSWKGIVMLLGALLFYALSAVLVKHYSTDIHPLVVNSGSLIVALPLLMLFTSSDDYRVFEMSDTVVYATLYLGVIGSFVGFVLYYYVLQNMSAIQAMMIPLITPIFALYIGSAVNEEVITSNTILGSGLVLSGLLVYMLHNNIKSLLRRSRILG